MRTVVLEVRSLKETLSDAARAMRIPRRAEGAERIGCDRPELLWQVLTAKRWELLKTLCGAGPDPAVSLLRRSSRLRRPGLLSPSPKHCAKKTLCLTSIKT